MQTADTVRVRLGLASRELPFPVDLGSSLPQPGLQRPELRPRYRAWEALWAERVTEALEAQRLALWESTRPVVRPRLRTPLPDIEVARFEPPTPPPEDEEIRPPPDAEAGERQPPADTLPPEPEPADTLADESAVDELVPDVLAQYADLGIILQGRVELGGGWTRSRPCNVTLQLNCNPSLIPDLQPDIQFGARVGGTISDRIHVSVDYDNRREFDAANNINVFYQGLEDEILQRVEVGDVSLALPRSQFLTQGIPAGNFGFRATGQMGPLDFQTVWAQQKGDLGSRELRLGGSGQGFEQEAVTKLDDADYERGRFFFLFDPERLSGYPHVDAQRLNASEAPPELRPVTPVKLYRYEGGTIGSGNQIPEGFITAVATAVDTFVTSVGTDTVVVDSLSGLFRPLSEGEDYILHQSGTWVLLRNTLNDAEGLAVTYVAASGDSIGDYNAEELSDANSRDPANPRPVLELIKAVNHRPGTATWDREMHQVYRVSGSPGVVESSIELIISQGDPELGNTFRETAATQLEFLKIFGLDDNPTDNRVDVSAIYQATGTGADAVSGPAGTYLMFPTLEPFQAPPPLRDVPSGLDGQPFPLSGGDQNVAIYEESNDQIRRGANLYLLTVRYRQQFEGFVSTIALGAGGVREGSERVFIEDQELVRGEDYTIDYEVGQVELREPERWFRNNPNASVRVTFEQKPLFQLAPTSVFGLQARYGLGRTGELNFIGLSQNEQTLQTRPELGLEPAAVQLGGVSGRLNFEPEFLTRAVDALPGVRADAPSALAIDGEVAMSLPTTNTEGVTFVEDFEGGSGFRLSALSRAWRLGSAPSTVAGAEFVAPGSFDLASAGELVWQDQFTQGGQIVGGFEPRQIDDELQVQGRTIAEPVLWLSMRNPANAIIGPAPSDPPGPSWRSITTNISLNGQDFTTIEFLEFYVGLPPVVADSVDLILDLGTVSEDAFAFDSLRSISGAFFLDREVEPPRVWSNADDIGLWETGCRAQPGVISYPLGDVRANCTNNNGLEDTEDLNENNVLDTEERFFRYTVDIGNPAGRYFVREANQSAGLQFYLFRIPLRRPDHRERVTDAEFQNIRHLRVTVVGEGVGGGALLVLARMNFLGSRFLKRGRAGVVASLSDTVSAPGSAQVDVGPISTLDSRYEPPPGITDEIANQADQFSIGGLEFNEQSLSISFTDLPPDHRAEVYLQYTQTPRDFLAYRGLRAWALGIDGSWGPDSDLRFFIKLGESARNFYLYQTPLPEVPPGTSGNDLREAWRPELLVDLDRFIALRTRAEEIMFQTDVPVDSVLQVWDVDVFEDGDSTYAVFITQRSRAPNLAAIRQVSLGVHNAGLAIQPAGEIWVDDMRLDRAVDNTGVVSRVNVDLQASDVIGVNLSYSSENPYFRQLATNPSFRSAGEFQLGSRLQAGRFMPEGWGIRMPVSVRYAKSSSSPILLPRTDILGEGLSGLRTASSRDVRLDVNLSRQARGSLPGVGWLVDNSSLRFSYNDRTTTNSRSLTDFTSFAAGYSYRSNVLDLSVPLFKPFFFLPSSIRDSELRLTPRTMQLSTSYMDSEADTRRFQEIVELPSDTAVQPIQTLDEQLTNTLGLELAPFSSVNGNIAITEQRELIPTPKLVESRAARRLISRERASLFGLDLGWMRSRSVTTNLSFRPNLASWLNLQATADTRYRFSRSASFITVIDGDTVLTSNFDNGRNLRSTVSFNLSAFLESLLGPEQGGFAGALIGVARVLDIFTASWNNSLTSTFDRRSVDPRLGYHLGLGGFESFQFIGADTASRVFENEGVSVSSGLVLPLGIGLNIDYADNEGSTWTPVNQTLAGTTTWPRISVNWNRLPLPGFVTGFLQSLGLRSGYSVRTSDRNIVGADQDRRTRTENVPAGVTLATTTGWNLNYNLDLSDEERFDPTGVTLADAVSHAVSLNGRIQLPSDNQALRSPIRISLRLSQTDRKECRQLGLDEQGTTLCQPFTDLRIRRVDVTADTDIDNFVLGLQGSWRDTQSEIGQRPGNTQLEISVFGQFLLQTGEIR